MMLQNVTNAGVPPLMPTNLPLIGFVWTVPLGICFNETGA